MNRRADRSTSTSVGAVVAAGVAALVGVVGCSGGTPDGGSAATNATTSSAGPSPTTWTSTPAATGSGTATFTVTQPVTSPVTVATGLDVPWGLALLPDGSALVTLRDRAEVLQIRPGSQPVPVGRVAGVVPGGEAGLLGIALSPDFAEDARVYLYYTAADDNRVVTTTFRDGRLGTEQNVILSGIPKAGNHDGGRLAFGPDGYLYVGTGDAADTANSQNRESLGGKILRVTRSGAAAPRNPFHNRVWTLGHRNVQGLAWTADGTMYASEFGQDTYDELNRIEKGRNYGWPLVEGPSGDSRFVDPVAAWGTQEASPSGIAVGADGAVYMAALRGESLWRVPLSGSSAGEPQRLLHQAYGRLRTVTRDAAGNLWLVTSNTFRGTARAGDDRVLILPPDPA